MLTLLGLSHRHAPLDVRERLAVATDDLPALMQRLPAHLGAGAIVATCNRFELYVSGDRSRDEMIDFLVAEAGFDRALAAEHFEDLRDEDAVRHLYSVASGIDSMVLGEPEILGQVRGAFSMMVRAGAEDALLSRLFHTAVRAGRRARADTGVGRHALSLSSIAVQETTALHPDLERARVLVLGAGEAGRQAAESLVDRGVAGVTVVNRTFARAEALAADLGGFAVPFEQLAAAVAEADVVIAASGSPQHLIECEQVAEVMRGRPDRPLLIVDIALPRDIDPAVRELTGVVYRDLDDLQAISERNARARQAEVASVREIVHEEAARFMQWWRTLEVVPTIAALTERAERLREQQLAKTLRTLDASPEVRDQLESLTRAIVKQLLHDPISTLRQRGDRDEYVHAVRKLFRLDEPIADGVDEVEPAITAGDQQ